MITESNKAKEENMKPIAIVMLILGLALLYGGLAWCIGIAWYHGKTIDRNKARKKQGHQHDGLEER